MKKLLIIIIFAYAITSYGQTCKNYSFTQEHYTRADSLLADSLLKLAYSNEALYTLYTDIKPMSTVSQFHFMLDSISMTPVDTFFFSYLMQLEKIRNWLSNENHSFLLIPFNNVGNHRRNMQLVVVSNYRLSQIISYKQDFWVYWGFTPGSSPATVVTTIENAGKYDRFRSYGYLFGYPDYAVDFFVDAARVFDETGEFVERSFYNIPVYSGLDGRFTYARPAETEPGKEDIELKKLAKSYLDAFKEEFNIFRQNNPSMTFLKWYLEKCSQ